MLHVVYIKGLKPTIDYFYLSFWYTSIYLSLDFWYTSIYLSLDFWYTSIYLSFWYTSIHTLRWDIMGYSWGFAFYHTVTGLFNVLIPPVCPLLLFIYQPHPQIKKPHKKTTTMDNNFNRKLIHRNEILVFFNK